MRLIYFASFTLAFFVSFVATFLVSRIAVRRKILDVPDSERRFHKTPTPTLGGIAIFSSFFLVTLSLGIFGGYLLNGNIPIKLLLGIWTAGAILMIGGYLDDRYRLPASQSIIFPIMAALVIISAGARAVSIHNPISGDIIQLSNLISGFVVFAWTMTLTYTTKILDGMDGLVTGIAAIGALVLFGLSLTPQVAQPQTAILAITFAGSMLGFLILNFFPGRKRFYFCRFHAGSAGHSLWWENRYSFASHGNSSARYGVGGFAAAGKPPIAVFRRPQTFALQIN